MDWLRLIDIFVGYTVETFPGYQGAVVKAT